MYRLPPSGHLGGGAGADPAHGGGGTRAHQAQHRRRAPRPGGALRAASALEAPIDRLYRLIGGRESARWDVSPELDQLLRAMVHKDPMARPTATDILNCDWIRRGDAASEAEVVAAFEQRRPRAARSGRTTPWS